VTNTNDFRKYSYSSDPSYLIESFSYSRASHAPKLRPQEDEGLKVHEGGKLKSKKQLRAEQKAAFKKAVLVVSVAVISLLMIAFSLHSFAEKNELTRQIQKTQTSISNANSEYISLQSQLDALVSISTIDKYAVEELNMTKVKSNQIRYISVEDFKNRTVSNNAEKTEQTKSNKDNK
jgi:cell division protein FtsL